MGSYDEWKTRTPDEHDGDRCPHCDGSGVIVEIDRNEIEHEHTCVCQPAESDDDRDPDDRPMSTEDRTGARDPD